MFNQYLQAGIEGICQTRYVIQDDSKNNRATISKSKDLTDCQEQAVENLGMAYIRPCLTCPPVRAARSHRCPARAQATAQPSHCADARRGLGLPGLTSPFLFLSGCLCPSREKEMLRAQWRSSTRWSMVTAGYRWRLLCQTRCTKSLLSMNPTGQQSWRQGRHCACPYIITARRRCLKRIYCWFFR